MPKRQLTAALIAALAIAGCGGGHQPAHPTAKPQLLQTITEPAGQRIYKVRLPNGQIVEQAHSPALAEPSKRLQLPSSSSLAGTVEQYDSVTVSTIPRSARYVAGYVDGHWPTYFQMRGRWPVVIGISVARGVGADCFDMEPGNPGPDAAGPWAKWQLTQGNARPCEYSMLSWMPAIRANLRVWGIGVCSTATQAGCVRLWDANWTFSRHLDGGYACTQWTDHAGGLNLDESTCASWFYTRPAPAPKPTPKPKPDPLATFVKSRFPSPWGALDEHKTVAQFLGAYAHREQYRDYLHGLLAAKLGWLAARDAYVATHVYHSWTPYQIGSRRAWLSNYSQKARTA